MTKQYNNEERYYGEYEENMEQKGKMENMKNTAKRFIKPVVISLSALLVLGGVGAFAYEKYEDSQKVKVRQAQTTIIANQANSQNISLKSEDEIKQIVASSLSIDQASITFEEIYLTNGYGDGKDGKKYRIYHSNGVVANQNNTQQTNTTSNNQTTTQPSSDATQNTIDQNTTANTNNNTSNTTSSTSTMQTVTPVYTYKVKARANSLEYKLLIDAKDGKVLSTKVDD